MLKAQVRSLAQHKLINNLLRSKTEAAENIAAQLSACTIDNPCTSPACFHCGMRFQQAALSVVERFIGVPSRAILGRKSAVTIVPPDGCVEPAALTADAWRRVAAQIIAAFEKLDFPPIVIGMEASFNEDATGRIKPHWCIHPHGISLDWISRAQVRGLQAEFPGSPLAKRPVHCTPLDYNIAGILYANKPERFRRVTFLETRHPTRKPYRDSKRRPLRPSQAVTLAIVEHELGFGWRMLTHGIDREDVRQHLAGLGWPRDGP